MVGKINLYGVGNEKNFNFYIFDKAQKIFEILRKEFKEIFNIEWPKYLEYHNEKDEPVQELRNIKNYRDMHEHLEKLKTLNRKVRIDVFYGNKRMFVIVHCDEKEKNLIKGYMKLV